jgi:hypothetical protein
MTWRAELLLIYPDVEERSLWDDASYWLERTGTTIRATIRCEKKRQDYIFAYLTYIIAQFG